MAFRLAVAVAGLLTASTVCAEPAPRADREGTLAYVELNAPENCATRDAFVEGIRRQSDAVHFVDRARAQRSLLAEIRPAPPAGFTAAFTLVESSGRSSQRQIAAKTCGEALEALTLLAALALDPHQDEAPLASPTQLAPPRPDVRAAAPPPAPPASAPLPLLPPPERVLVVAAGAGAVAAVGPTPEPMPGVFLYAGGSWDGRGPWSPAIRLTASHLSRDGVQQLGGVAGFALDYIGLDLCPIAAGPLRLTLRACAHGTWGQLSAHGTSTRAGANLHRPFGTVGGLVQLSFDPGFRMEFVARLGAGIPVVRDSFQFVGDSVFFRVQPVTVTAGLGVGFRIL